MGNQKNESLLTLDLHGATATEVDFKVDAFLLKASNSGKSRARIMTGKGKGIVQKLVIDYLKQANYMWKYEELSNGKKNEGVLVVFLN